MNRLKKNKNIFQNGWIRLGVFLLLSSCAVKVETKQSALSSRSPSSTAQTGDGGVPTLLLAEVQSAQMVDVTFSEGMGAGVTTPGNYVVSGTGKGNLAVNPSAVVWVVDNKYRLTWASGEMYQGGDITITAQNFADHSGLVINSSATHLGGGIGTAPDPMTSISLYSQYTSNTSATLTHSPDITLTYTGTDNVGGSGVGSYEYRILNSTTSAVLLGWTNVSTTTLFRASGLTLVDGDSYKVQVRVLDNAGNISTSIDSSTWQVVKISSTPYDGQSLSDVTTLADNTLNNTTLLNTTRTAPLEAKTLTLSGTIGWNTTGHTAIFLRADELVLNAGTIIHANGMDAANTSAGAKGGSGGGGAGTPGSGTLGGAGGSAGANGTNSSGAGGAGTAASYNSGFIYGTGGNGSAGTNANSGAGGTGGNGCGGGGGGTNGSGGKGGGAGAGLVVIVANTISGAGALQAMGGKLGGTNASGASPGNGGGGVIWVAAGTYNGNLSTNVVGGGVGELNSKQSAIGNSGLVKIYQINSDGTLTERRFIDSWDTDVATLGAIPIPVAQLADVTGLADATLTGPTTLDTKLYTRVNPYAAKILTVDGTISWDTTYFSALFLNVDELVFGASGVLDASGVNATNAAPGKGGSGGGSASGSTGSAGANGGSNGASAGATHSSSPASGIGTGLRYNMDFTYGTGGNGGNGGNGGSAGGTGGTGGNANGGGGGGGGAASSGMAGGGGGLVVIIANSVNGTGTVRAKGGNGITTSTFGSHGGGGGGGVIWIAAKSYNGGITADVSGGAAGAAPATAGTAGTAKIFKINNDGSLTQKLFTDTW